MKKSVNKSNGYSSRRFFSFPKNGTIPASFTLPTPTDTNPTICWSPVLKKYFYSDTKSAGSVYSQAPDGQKVLVHTYAGDYGSIHWSKTLQMLVLMTSTNIYTSTNGTVWTSRTIPASYAPDVLSGPFVDASTYLLVFGGESGTRYMYKTSDGVTWVRSATGITGTTEIVAGAIGDTVGYSNNAASDSDTIRYTSNGTTYATATANGNGSVKNFWPPTDVRAIFGYHYAGELYVSSDGITYSSSGMGTQGTISAGNPAWFGGLMRSYYTTAWIGEYLSLTIPSSAFVGGVSGYGVYPAETFVSIEGEYATYTNRTKAHRVGTWLDIGQFEIWLIGGGAPNASASVGGTAGCMVIHRLTVTEKWRYCVYVYLGAAAIVDTLTGEFLAYASMLTSTSTSAQVNTAGFGSEVYYGLGAKGSAGAACGPSNGLPAFLGSSGAGGATIAVGSMNSATTSATTPPDFWCPWDFAGNPGGTGYPGTVGSGGNYIGFMAASNISGTVGSYGSGGCNTSNALTTPGGDPLAIIYSR